MRIIMTGATSFVGAAAVHALLKRGHTVAAVVRPGSNKVNKITEENKQALLGKRLFVVENDLSEPKRLLQKLPKGADVFCHFGWGGSGSGSRTDRKLQEQNLTDSLRTLETAKALGCGRFLFSGSQAEYGFHEGLMTEEIPCSPRSAYGEAKLSMCQKGNMLAKTLGLTYLHVRIFSAYGPGDHPWTLVESCLDAFLKGEKLPLGKCTQKWNFLYIEDLADALCMLCEAPEYAFAKLANPAFNLAGGETRPLKEFVEEIDRLCGGRGTPCYNTRPENAEGIVNLIPSIEKLTDTVGWMPKTQFAEGILKTIRARKPGAIY
ncbi:MAG: NAD(P)-dependent oxidoreductase [Lachnospiraceae bacterium]|nr:NAD(P)-dependent oxidoreductase [Lachnospiraceae bacterium]